MPFRGILRQARKTGVDSGTICFLHVAKSAGTAFTEYLTSNIVSTSRNPSEPSGYYFGNHRIPSKHFDWSSIESLRKTIKDQTKNFEVITLLREPVSRGISHFNFIKRDRGWASKLLVGVTLEKLFGDLDLMMQVRGLWQDGQASVSWQDYKLAYEPSLARATMPVLTDS